MEFNKEKFKTVLSYPINRCENKANVGKTLICKLLYFSDFNYYEKYETAIIHHIDEVINEMFDERLLIIEKKPYIETTIHKHYLQKILDLTLLNTKELSIINELIDKISDMSAKKSENTLMETYHG